MNNINLNEIITADLAGLRLDQALARLFPQYSRTQFQSWIEQGVVRVDQKIITKVRGRVFPGQLVDIVTTLEDQGEWQPDDIPLDIIFEDEELLVINKPPGLVVHPGAGNPNLTLVNALLHYNENLVKLPRAGLIHRLDKDTSGLLLVAKTLETQNYLSTQMQARQIHRIYHAIVLGWSEPSGTINLPIGRHPTQRVKMTVLKSGGRHAVTHYTLLEKFQAHSYLEIALETGRTHQIRVHMAQINHPILGDQLYGRQVRNLYINAHLAQLLADFKRQALHAKKLVFAHPKTNEMCSIESPLPLDFQEIVMALREGVRVGEQNLSQDKKR
jgi:23S rRNA pseudouridine1911/1915/1917 synthase